jgi:hypothetical protein
VKRLLAEPLIHFLLLAVALFGLHAALRRVPAGGATDSELVVSRERIAGLAESFARQWGRAPSEEELAVMVEDFVREEVLMREALRLGLDRDDAIVRRRLAQKMEFLSEDLVAMASPTEEDLRAFLAANPERFRTPARFTFRQLQLDPAKHGDALASDADALLRALRAGGDARAIGDGRLLEPEQRDLTPHDAEATFGPEFAARLAELPVGSWEGPVPSGYGVHLVRLERRQLGDVPPLADVRDAVAREWTAARRAELKRAQLEALLARYRVTIEAPPRLVADATR